MNSLIFPIVLLSLMLISGCSSMATQESEESSTPKAKYEQLISQVESAYKGVDAQGGAWRDTEENIAAAKKAAESQNYEKAIELAKMALEETMLAKKQSDSQQEVKPWQFN